MKEDADKRNSAVGILHPDLQEEERQDSCISSEHLNQLCKEQAREGYPSLVKFGKASKWVPEATL